MEINRDKVFKVLNPNRVWLPILFGLGIVFFLFYNDDEISAAKLQMIFHASFWPVLFAFLVLIARDVGYIYRIRQITGKKLTWKNSLFVIILWEFASAVTPSIVGGTAAAVFIMMKEKIPFGKSLAYVMLTAILDNLFFVVMAPIALFIAWHQLFPESSALQSQIGNSIQYIFVISYLLIAFYTAIMAYAVFIKPRGFKWLLLKITSYRFFRRWRTAANEQGNEIILASSELKGHSKRYWFKICAATFFIWSARYAMVNCLIAAFANINFADHLLIFGRHIIMWIIMLISPTPGSSGTAEFFFIPFFKEFLGDYTIVTSLFWRMMSYYPYLILGALFLPHWIKRRFIK
ncbi:MAG: flippase-like domain-containing protein [Cyclobacteriaceae bacterium]|nr:flippase-like domain-containing protein [Cyclobacteriaceae bacterium]MCH8517628.1 flippase-like domain-containing protein [Cyclobacteriaceae bacterium]